MEVSFVTVLFETLLIRRPRLPVSFGLLFVLIVMEGFGCSEMFVTCK